jgi:hypothetical protein
MYTEDMKKTPLKRKTGLKRNPIKRRNKPLRHRSKRMQDIYNKPDGRKAFISVFLADNPNCQVKWEGCQEGSRDVHEFIARGIGGAILPGEQATRQGQRFIAICRSCHNALDNEPKRAYEEGWKAPSGRSHNRLPD